MDSRLLILSAASLVLAAAAVWALVSVFRASRRSAAGPPLSETETVAATAVRSDSSIGTTPRGMAVDVAPDNASVPPQPLAEVGGWQPPAEPAPVARLAEVSLANRISAQETNARVRQAEASNAEEPETAVAASAESLPERPVTPVPIPNASPPAAAPSLESVVPVVRQEQPTFQPSAPVAVAPPELLAAVAREVAPAVAPAPELALAPVPVLVPAPELPLAPQLPPEPAPEPGAEPVPKLSSIAPSPVVRPTVDPEPEPPPPPAAKAAPSVAAPGRPKTVVRAGALGAISSQAPSDIGSAHLHDDGATRAGVAPFALSAPVEMWFGDSRVGVRGGTKTWEQFRRYADVLLGDLKEPPAQDR